MQAVHSIPGRASFFLFKNPMMLFLFLAISLFAKSQETRINQETEIRTARRRVDTEEKKREVKDSSIVKLPEAKKKPVSENKRKAKAIYTGPQDTQQFADFPSASFLVTRQKPEL